MFLQIGKNIIVPQWLAGIGVTLLLTHVGFLGGWASPTLARLISPDSPIHLNPVQASWVASLVNFSRFFGGFMGAFVLNYLGSKSSILVTLFPLTLGWLIIVFADSVEWLYIARLSGGVGLGMTLSTFPLYIGEVSMSEIRGALISLATVGAPFGQVIASVCGSYLSMGAASSIYLVVALLLMVLFFWLPESPHHLIKSKNYEAAKKSISWYRAGREVDKEFEAVEKFVTSNGSQTFLDKLKDFKTPAIRKATFQIIILFSFQQLTGLNIIMFFMESILIKAKFTLISPALVVIYVNLCSTFAAAGSIFLIDRCGRKFLLLVGSIGCAISLIGLSSHFLLIDMKEDITNLQWLPLASVSVYMISFFLGLFPVPNALLSETFPSNIKWIAACIAILTGGVMSFLSSKTYQPLIDEIGEAYVFLIYAICCIVVIPYTLFAMTETKGKSLQQIQDEFIKK